MRRSLSIAILGTRGVPPRYGGFETFAAELGRRLAARGHRVTVYARRHLYPERPESWEGIELVHLPSIRSKYFETVSNTVLSAFHALRGGYDAVLLCNAANAFVLPILRIAGIPVATNVDGIERLRKKWNLAGRLVYRAGETLAARFSSGVIADAETIAAYYRGRYRIDPEVIAYGSDFPEGEPDTDILGKLGIQSGKYVLYVSRLEPENNPIEVVEAYRRIETRLPLVLVGSAPYSGSLIERLREAAFAPGGTVVLLPGAIYGGDYRTLQRNAALYIQATEVGGTHPALIEAMSSNGAVIALDTPENREVGGETIDYFRFDQEPRLESLLVTRLSALSRIDREPARQRARQRYSWEAVTDRYEELFERLARGKQ